MLVFAHALRSCVFLRPALMYHSHFPMIQTTMNVSRVYIHKINMPWFVHTFVKQTSTGLKRASRFHETWQRFVTLRKDIVGRAQTVAKKLGCSINPYLSFCRTLHHKCKFSHRATKMACLLGVGLVVLDSEDRRGKRHAADTNDDWKGGHRK